MKMNDECNYLLENTVNLKEGKLGQLEEKVPTVFEALRQSAAIGHLVEDWIPQGSWAHRTIINPPGTAEYDADFLLVLKHNPDWDDDPVKYRNAVWQALHDHPIYGSMPHNRKCRCVRLTYANDFHLDIVPYVQLPSAAVIVNADERGGRGDWERTDPQGFTTWFNTADGIANGNFRTAVRLFKFLRDSKGTFRGTRSVILTTLLGNLVTWNRAAQEPGCYEDLPRTFRTLAVDLDAWLQARPNQPSVADPSGTGLTFDHRWDATAYNALRDRMHGYAAAVVAAYNETDPNTSLQLWQALFGPGFKQPPLDITTPRFAPAPVHTQTPSRAG